MVRTLAKIVLPLVVLAAGLAGTLAVIASAPEVEPRAPKRSVPAVVAVRAIARSVQIPVTVHGTVEPAGQVAVVPQVSGRVVFLSPSVKEGAFFTKGEVLVRLERRDYELALVQATAAAAQAQARLEREEAEARVARSEWERYGRGEPNALVLREPQLAEARAILLSAEARCDEAELALSRTEIRAPIAGRVHSESVDEGQFLLAGATIALLHATDRVEVRLAVPDDQLAHLELPLATSGDGAGNGKGGPEVTIRAEFSGVSCEWVGRIVRTGAAVDPRSRVVHVLVRVDDPYRPRAEGGMPLLVGMYVTAELLGRELPGLVALPRAALRSGDRVLVVSEDHRIHWRDVVVQRKGAEEVLLASGIESGELVCVSPLDLVVEGMEVRLEEER